MTGRTDASSLAFGLGQVGIRNAQAPLGGAEVKARMKVLLRAAVGSMAGLFGSAAYAGSVDFHFAWKPVVPEPASILLMIAGLGVLVLLRRDGAT